MEVPITLLSILTLILTYVPGLVFKRFYFTGEFTKQFGAGIFLERFITCIFAGVVIQLVTYFIFWKFIKVDTEATFGNVKVFYRQFVSNEIPGSIDDYKNLCFYIVISILVAVFGGLISHNLVRLLKLDLKFNVLRFSNHWNYYFKGDILSTRDFKAFNKGKVISTEADVFVDSGGDRPVLYSGLLVQHNISAKTGDLESIFLTNSYRYSTKIEGMKEIPGDILMIPYSKIVNLNIRYNVKKQKEGGNKEVIIAIQSLIFIVVFVAILISVPYFFYSRIGTIKTILAVITSWISLLLIAVLTSPKTYQDKNFGGSAVGTSIAFIVLFIVFTYLLLK
ncbi:hypothetical protein ABDK00_013290 [Niabella insulamsoli]|uniref:hypothetical protein n=1 Tax=Niabella insulamsoli TaxID=3144874 RepID=UPI0031FC32B2